MPDLPTLTVTTEQQTRILNAFKAKYGTSTAAETIAAYKAQLANMIKKVVLDYEKEAIDSSAYTQKSSLATDINNNLIPPQ